MVILYYSKGRFIKWEHLEPDNLGRYVAWVNSGNHVLIRGTLTNNLAYIAGVCAAAPKTRTFYEVDSVTG